MIVLSMPAVFRWHWSRKQNGLWLPSSYDWSHGSHPGSESMHQKRMTVCSVLAIQLLLLLLLLLSFIKHSHRIREGNFTERYRALNGALR